MALALPAALGLPAAAQGPDGDLAGKPAAPSVSLELSTREATVGDPIELTLSVELAQNTRLATSELGPELGPFTALDGGWEPPEEGQGRTRQVWRGTIAAYRTGKLTLPAIAVHVEGQGGSAVQSTKPQEIEILSVLPPQGAGEAPELADLKAPASVEANFRPLWLAALILLALLLLTGVVWWLARRFAGKLAGRPAPADPFHRMPPHVWAFGELQRLLARRLAEQGKVEAFHEELAWILKRYLSGRYRLELMERTTAEVLPLLRQTGAPDGPSAKGRAVLDTCDRVKFAQGGADAAACRAAVETTYAIIDATKPAEPGPRLPEAQAAPRKGAA